MTGPGREEHPTACSSQTSFEFGTPLPASTLQNRVDTFLSDLTTFLRDSGCQLIGHIKGVLDAGNGGQLFFSITSFDEGIRYKESIDDKIPAATFSINVIVYGVGEEAVAEAVRDLLRKHFSEDRET
jgi:hypothetical protein